MSNNNLSFLFNWFALGKASFWHLGKKDTHFKIQDQTFLGLLSVSRKTEVAFSCKTYSYKLYLQLQFFFFFNSECKPEVTQIVCMHVTGLFVISVLQTSC